MGKGTLLGIFAVCMALSIVVTPYITNAITGNQGSETSKPTINETNPNNKGSHEHNNEGISIIVSEGVSKTIVYSILGGLVIFIVVCATYLYFKPKD